MITGYLCSMNSYNRVFASIQRLSETKDFLKGTHCFDMIRDAANVPFSRLFDFLTSLQNLGLINYSFEDNYIELTELGKKQDKLFVV